MSALGNRQDALESRGVGGGTSSERAIQHRIAARRGHAQSRTELQQEAREHNYPYYYRMGVEFLEDKKAQGWPELTQGERDQFSSSGGGSVGEGEWAQQS